MFNPLVLSFLAASTGLGTTIFDDFNDGNDTSPQWNFRDVSDQGGGGLGSRGFGPDNQRYQLNGPASVSVRADFILTDGEVRCEMSGWNPSVPVGSSVGILARFNADTLSGYFLSIDADGSPNLNLVKLVGGVPSGGTGGPTKAYDPSKTYILQLLAAGAELTCRVYEKGSPANILIDEFVWTDPSPFTSGVTGLLVANDDFPASLASATAIFDNFLATDGLVAEPTLSNPGLAGENFQLSFGAEPGRTYVVESKRAVTDPQWEPVSTIPPKPLAGVEAASDPLAEGLRIYQVRVVDDSP
jgi:hypothetical protein